MTINKKLAKYLIERKKSDAYWVEAAKLDFAVALERQVRLAGLSYAALAKKIGTSAAYVSKIFRGDTPNMTIETMVKFARASGGRVNIEIITESVAVQRWDKRIVPFPVVNKPPQVTAVAATFYHLANHPAGNMDTPIKEAA